MIWPSFMLMAIALTLLGGSSGAVISSLVAISEKRGLRKSVLSFLLVAFSTSLPELSVAADAIIIGNMSVSLGDILGSNITNISLVFGACLVVATLKHSNERKISFGREERREFKTGLMLLSITLLTLLYLQYVSRLIGVFLLGVFVGYSYVLIRKRRVKVDGVSNGKIDGRIGKDLVLISTGIVGVIIGAKLTLESAIDIATYFGIPSSIIGATLVALGTSLPELAVDIRAAYKGYLEIAMGEIIGSCFLNSTFVLGLLLAFTPFKVNVLVLSDLILFSVVSNLLLWHFLDNEQMGGREGSILLTVYVVNLLSILGILILRIP